MKTRLSNSTILLIATLLPLPVWVWTALALLPVFIRLLIPFPHTSSATVYTGVLREEQSTNHYLILPKYYINTNSGDHQVFCSYLAKRTRCSAFEHGATATLWYSPMYGVIQYDVQGKSGRNFVAREKIKRVLIDDFDFSRHSRDLFTITLLSAFMLSMALKWKKAKALENKLT
jgi:hypothetical protein